MKFAIAAMLLPAAALAERYDCDGWDNHLAGEGGPIILDVDADGLIWTNGSKVSIYRRIENLHYQIFSNGTDLIITERASLPFFQTRRVFLNGEKPNAQTSCR